MTGQMLETKLATFAAGRFWLLEDAFLSSGKVISTRVGYTGGHIERPTFEQVNLGRTGHIQAVEVTFDVKKTKFKDLLGIFWRSHDSTINYQKNLGRQYKSAIFYHNSEQFKEAVKTLRQVQKRHNDRVLTEILPARRFYPAEQYHQRLIQRATMQSVVEEFTNTFTLKDPTKIR